VFQIFYANLINYSMQPSHLSLKTLKLNSRHLRF